MTTLRFLLCFACALFWGALTYLITGELIATLIVTGVVGFVAGMGMSLGRSS